MKKDSARDLKPTPNRDWSENNIGHIGQPRAALLEVADIHQDMPITKLDAQLKSVTIPLADLGVAVPDGTTVDARIIQRGIEIDRREETFIVERDGGDYALTGVIGRDELPERIPAWLEPVAECFGISEVRLGR